MCGRYVVKTPIKTIAKMHRVFDAPLFEPRYNVAPTQTVPIVRAAPSTLGELIDSDPPLHSF